MLPRDVGVVTDGVYGARTEAAIRLFQESYGMPIEGDIERQLNTVLSVLKSRDGRDGKADLETVQENQKAVIKVGKEENAPRGGKVVGRGD